MARPAVGKELFSGTLPLMVLRLIGEADHYGYLIIKRIGRLSGGAFEFKEGTLYPILHSFERDGLVTGYWREAGGRRRRYYRITDAGMAELSRRRTEWSSFVNAMDGVLTGEVADEASN